jgi:signal transduction histidine kinase
VTGASAPLGKRPWVAQIPLLSGRDTLGLLIVASRRPGVMKDPVVLDLLATRLGAAFDHAALYEAAYARERDLEDLEARRREFMAAIAHEIRTPLTSIQAFADLLQLGRPHMDETASSLVGSLGQGVQRLSALVNDLIDLGRSGHSAYPVEPRDVDLGAVIRSAEATLRPALMLRQHAVTLDLPPSGPIAHADPRVLEQVVLNLLSNANRHSPAAGSIRVSAVLLDGNTVRMEVDDDGPGIPEAEREHIFQPYYRIRSESGATVPGSGLGLAVARQLLDECGGRIWVDAGSSGGARFCVEVRSGVMKG